MTEIGWKKRCTNKHWATVFNSTDKVTGVEVTSCHPHSLAQENYLPHDQVDLRSPSWWTVAEQLWFTLVHTKRRGLLISLTTLLISFPLTICSWSPRILSEKIWNKNVQGRRIKTMIGRGRQRLGNGMNRLQVREWISEPVNDSREHFVLLVSV